MLKALLHAPRKIFLRRALFQIHLWLGVLLSLYVAVIGLSGSILVWEDELRKVSLHGVHFDPAHAASVDTAIEQTQKRYPGTRASYVVLPSEGDPRWGMYLSTSPGKYRYVYADSTTGVPFPEGPQPLLDRVQDLHVNLLAGQTGFVVNCVCGIGLLVLAMTGLILWWPGLRQWKRGFFISLRARWRRINYDAHNAVGIWTLLIVSWWGITAVYFLFPKQVTSAINAVSPLKGMAEPPAPKIAHPQAASLPMQTIVDLARKTSPGHVSGLFLPATPGATVSVDVQRTPGDFTHRDQDIFDSGTGQLLSQWHYGQNHSLGDWIVWLMYPLHFGTLWGTSVKVAWCLLGLSLPILSVTGLLMYWNRFLSKRWRSITDGTLSHDQ
ncbi:putative iron-regulated membrane protein [Terriglobus roseus DSM 18391]|uniref:Putative iron-regulated membrane protein n=1 Tax=Terriglobus roseus (strain DSM 18391 / NRRL B-41598 / KBS 63) TaxID=926566 RepID=I3ZDW8_TERRK|nr:PepSY-associated TM helix domain-containing protein [Terriglobus roseus]AFL87436.1 putative iron-regulated membrane protein [Terriglobus roseus DSM 18391]